MVLLLNPSPWIVRWSDLLEPATPVLDVACGAGRHLQWFAARGHPVTGVDRDIEHASRLNPHAELISSDLETQAWPLYQHEAIRTFGSVVVTNYLWRPLLETIVASVAPGGVLLYETFAAGNGTLGRPARPEFLLQPGELLTVCNGLDIVAYEHGFLEPPARLVQRIAAVRRRSPEDRPLESRRCSL